MSSTTRVLPIVQISNTPKGILEYIVQRTADTIGKQVDRSQVVIVGDVQKSVARSLPIRPEHAATLQPWFSGEAGMGLQIIIHFTSVQVERWLVGPGEAKQLEIAYADPTMIVNGGPDLIPLFDVGDRGLIFLQKVSPDVPYAPYIPQPAYQLAPGEIGMRNFLLTDYDEQGQPFTRNETAKVEETIAAVQWYAVLPREKPEALHHILLQALDSANPQIVHHAIRVLAYRGDSIMAQVFKERLQSAKESLRIRLMIGLWILGEQEAAENILEEFFRIHGKYAWLAQWGVKPSLIEEGHPIDTLYGPDPSEFKGD